MIGKKSDILDGYYHKALSKNNLYKILVRLGPKSLSAHIMRAASDPNYGREMSIAQQEFEKPQTRFPLIEATREHERSENNNSPQKVYNISFSQVFNGNEKGKDGKDKKNKGKDYEPYKQGYQDSYKSDKKPIVVYGQKTAKDDKKSPYSAKLLSESLKEKILEYFKKEYKAEFPEGNSLYMKSLRILSGIYNASKNKYAKANGYNPDAEAGNYSESDNAYPVLPGAAYGITVQYASPPKKPANDNYILEQRLGIKAVSAQGGLEGKIAA